MDGTDRGGGRVGARTSLPRRLRLCLLAFLLLVSGAFAGPEENRALKEEPTVARVLGAHRAGVAGTLAEIAAEESTRPWEACEHLVQIGEGEAAAAFAAAVVRPDGDSLRAYVVRIRGLPSGSALLELRRTVQDHVHEGRSEKAVAAARALPIEAWPVTRVLVAEWESEALATLGRAEEAGHRLEDAAAAAEGIGWLQGAEGSLDLAGSCYDRQGRLREVLRPWRRRIEILERAGSVRDRLSARANLGSAEVAAGEAEEGIRRLRGVVAETGDLPDLRTKVLQLLGAHLLNLGRFDEAEPVLREALEGARANGDADSASTCLQNLGLLLERQGDLDGALQLHVEALKFGMEAVQRHPNWETAARVVEAMVRPARNRMRAGQYGHALTFLELALQAAEALPRPFVVGDILLLASEAHRRTGDLAEAERTLGEALRRLEGDQDVRRRIRAASARADLHQAKGEGAEAIRIMREALAEVGRAVGPHTLAELHLSLGHLLLSAGEPAEALSVLKEALRSDPSSADPMLGSEILLAIASALRRTGKPEQAEGPLLTLREALGDLPISGHAAEVHEELALVHLETGRPQEALADVRRAVDRLAEALENLGDEEGGALRDDSARVFRIGAEAAVRLGSPADLFEMLERARAGTLLEDLLFREAVRALPEEPKETKRESALREEERIARAALREARRGGVLAEVRAAQGRLDQALEARRAHARHRYRRAKQEVGEERPAVAALAEAQAALAGDEALVLLGTRLEAALALVVTRTEARVVGFGDASRLAGLEEAFRPEDPAGPYEEGLSRIREVFIEPLGIPPGTHRVIFSPIAGVECMPLTLLLGDREVVMVPSATLYLLLRAQRGDRGKEVLAFGDPVYDGEDPPEDGPVRRDFRLVPLPGTRLEAEAIATRTRLGREATETAAWAALESPVRWRALHFACHGLVDQDRPHRSALALTSDGENDGFLTCLELVRTKVSADLVTLSACETSLGKVFQSEGVIGPVRSFLAAGAPRVLASLWNVDDEATRALMVRFYERWNPREGAGVPASQALREAQEHVRSQERWRHPHYWAGWSLWGVP